MVTALNHVVADGRRAGGLNLSSSILTDYREGGRRRERGRRRCLPPRSNVFWTENDRNAKIKINQYLGDSTKWIHFYSFEMKLNTHVEKTKTIG